MARKTTAVATGDRRKRRFPPQQMDLFASGLAAGAPSWPDLPKDAREVLVSLMTRLILEHARTTATPTMTMGAGHDH